MPREANIILGRRLVDFIFFTGCLRSGTEPLGVQRDPNNRLYRGICMLLRMKG